MTDSDLQQLVEALQEHLAATATLPVREDASRWLGEAEAVATDLTTAPLPSADVTRTRLGHVEHLLEQVDGTDDAEADRHVEAARESLAEALAALDGQN
ncbi:hypothetical protein [Haloferax sp. DFSO52]|uniref:hypothetical protein n=1 Tax=Haloferax sp. DFSO52 TaxID=3388505 RepID=UPI003A8B7F91